MVRNNLDQVLWRMMVVRTLVSAHDLFILNGYRDDRTLHRKRFFLCLFQKNLDHVPQDNQDQVLRRMMVVRTLVTEYDTFTLNGSLISVMKLLYIESTFVVCIFQNDLSKEVLQTSRRWQPPKFLQLILGQK